MTAGSPVIRPKESCRPVKPTRQSAPTVEDKCVSAVGCSRLPMRFHADHHRAHLGGGPRWRSRVSGPHAMAVGRLALGGGLDLRHLVRSLICGPALAWLYFKDPALLAERFRKPGSGGQSRSDLIILIGVKLGAILAWFLCTVFRRALRLDSSPTVVVRSMRRHSAARG